MYNCYQYIVANDGIDTANAYGYIEQVECLCVRFTNWKLQMMYICL